MELLAHLRTCGSHIRACNVEDKNIGRIAICTLESTKKKTKAVPCMSCLVDFFHFFHGLLRLHFVSMHWTWIVVINSGCMGNLGQHNLIQGFQDRLFLCCTTDKKNQNCLTRWENKLDCQFLGIIEAFQSQVAPEMWLCTQILEDWALEREQKVVWQAKCGEHFFLCAWAFSSKRFKIQIG